LAAHRAASRHAADEIVGIKAAVDQRLAESAARLAATAELLLRVPQRARR
jgi:hypothetical protein